MTAPGTAVRATARRPARLGAELVLRLLAAGGLGVDAYVHLHIAGDYGAVRTSSLTEAQLFRVEAVLAVVAAAAVLLVRRWYTALAPALVAGGGLALLLLYRYQRVGAVGPIPSMYEPVWFHDKTVTAWAQGAATLAALALLAVPPRRPALPPTDLERGRA